MSYHYPHQQHPQQPLSTTFPSSTPYTLPPPLLQALHRLATFSSDIQLLTSHFAPHLHFNSYHSHISPAPRSLARRRKPTPRSTAWRLQNSLPPDPRLQNSLPPDPRAHPPIATTPLLSLVPTSLISTLPPRPFSAPPLERNRPVPEVPRSSSIPPHITRSRLQAKPRELAQIPPLTDSTDLKLLPQNSIKSRSVTSTTPVIDLIQPDPVLSSTSERAVKQSSLHAPTDHAVLKSQPATVLAPAPATAPAPALATVPDPAPTIVTVIPLCATTIKSVPIAGVVPEPTAHSSRLIDDLAYSRTFNPMLDTPDSQINTCTDVHLPPTSPTETSPTVFEPNGDVDLTSDCDVDFNSSVGIDLDVCIDLINTATTNASSHTITTDPVMNVNDSSIETPPHTDLATGPAIAIDLIPNTPNSCLDTSDQADLDLIPVVNLIDPISDTNSSQASATDADRVHAVSNVDLVLHDQPGSNPSGVISGSLSLLAEPISSISEVPIPPSTSSQLANSITFSDNMNSSSIIKNNKKKKKKKKSKRPTVATPSPHHLASELSPTSNFVLSSEEGWIEFDPVSGNRVGPSPCGHTYEDWEHAGEKAFDPKEGWIEIEVDHDNKWHPRSQRTHYEQLLMVNHLLDQHLDYLLLRVNRQGILLGKDRDKDPHEQDVICYSSSGEFSFRRENGKVFHHPSDSFC